MTYKLPEPNGKMTHGEFIGNVFIRPSAWNESQMQAAYAAGQRDMLERAVATAKTNV